MADNDDKPIQKDESKQMEKHESKTVEKNENTSSDEDGNKPTEKEESKSADEKDGKTSDKDENKPGDKDKSKPTDEVENKSANQDESKSIDDDKKKPIKNKEGTPSDKDVNKPTDTDKSQPTDKKEYKRPVKKTKFKKFGRCIWKSETKEFLGRTGKSWAKLLLFYAILYIFLAAFCVTAMFIYYQTLTDGQPNYYLDESRMGTKPGLGFRPRPPYENVASTLIWFNTSRPSTVDYWVKNLNDFLEPYEENSSNGVDCGNENKAPPGKFCLFPIEKGEDKNCTSENKFGYPDGKPCILIKLNKMYNWEPESYPKPPDKMSERLKEKFDPKLLYITCDGEESGDKDNVGEFNYYPQQGIPFYYFPFTNQKGYTSPFVFVQLSGLSRGVVLMIECRAWAKNIMYHKGDKTGSVHFELLVD